jgi:hypothetical protein
MTIRNAGRVLSQWKFIPPKEGEQNISKPWLSFYPIEGVLAPGEEMKITATLCVRPLHVELMRLTHAQAEPLSDDNVRILTVFYPAVGVKCFVSLLHFEYTSINQSINQSIKHPNN